MSCSNSKLQLARNPKNLKKYIKSQIKGQSWNSVHAFFLVFFSVSEDFFGEGRKIQQKPVKMNVKMLMTF